MREVAEEASLAAVVVESGGGGVPFPFAVDRCLSCDFVKRLT